jgi:hypothetical protein
MFLIKWNILTPNLIILVAEIVTIKYILSLYYYFLASLSSIQELKNIKNKF